MIWHRFSNGATAIIFLAMSFASASNAQYKTGDFHRYQPVTTVCVCFKQAI